MLGTLVLLLVADQITKIELGVNYLFDPGAGNWAMAAPAVKSLPGAAVVGGVGAGASLLFLWAIFSPLSSRLSRLSAGALVLSAAGWIGNVASRLGLSSLSNARLGVPNFFSLNTGVGGLGNLADVYAVLGELLFVAAGCRLAWRRACRPVPIPSRRTIGLVVATTVLAGGWSGWWWTNRATASIRAGDGTPRNGAAVLAIIRRGGPPAVNVVDSGDVALLSPLQAVQASAALLAQHQPNAAANVIELVRGPVAPAGWSRLFLRARVGRDVSSPPVWLWAAWLATTPHSPTWRLGALGQAEYEASFCQLPLVGDSSARLALAQQCGRGEIWLAQHPTAA